MSLTSLMEDVTDPSDWQDDFGILKNLDQSLRCDLCFDIYTSPVSIKSCHHTYCSSCIRTHINQSGNSGSFCPKCRQTKAYDSELIPQPVLETTALEWRKARTFLARLQQLQKQHQSVPPPIPSDANQAQNQASASEGSTKRHSIASSKDACTSPRRSKRIRIEPSTAAGSRSSPLTIEDDDPREDPSPADFDDISPAYDEDPDDDDYTDANPVHSPQKNGKLHSVVSTSTLPDTQRQLKPSDTVNCPICNHDFTVTALNRHLDVANCYPGFPQPTPEQRGFGIASTTSTAATNSKSRSASSWFTTNSSSPIMSDSIPLANEKRLVRPQYNLKSDRDLRKLLDDTGLPTSGDRDKLIERHRQWINIWNANLDSTKARRPISQLKKELASWERNRSTTKDHAATLDRQGTTWITSNKSQFEDLIQKAKLGAAKDKTASKQNDEAPASVSPKD